MPQSRLAAWRACAVVGVAAIVAGALVLLSAGSAGSSTLPRPSRALYYETAVTPATYAIDKLSLSAPRVSTQVVEVGSASLFGIAVGGPYIYWSTEHGARDRGAIMRASLNGEHVRRMVGGVTSADSVIAVHGYIYWADRHAIGRMALDGSHLQRHLIDLPVEQANAVAASIASDGTYLYFSRCDDNTIGRADLDGNDVDEGFISLGAKSCPQGLAVAGTAYLLDATRVRDDWPREAERKRHRRTMARHPQLARTVPSCRRSRPRLLDVGWRGRRAVVYRAGRRQSVTPRSPLSA